MQDDGLSLHRWNVVSRSLRATSHDWRATFVEVERGGVVQSGGTPASARPVLWQSLSVELQQYLYLASMKSDSGAVLRVIDAGSMP